MTSCKILTGKDAERVSKMPFGKRHVIMQARAQKCSISKMRGK